MVTYRCHFHVGPGVTAVLELVLERKHYDESALDAACQKLAEKLDAAFLYREEVESP